MELVKTYSTTELTQEAPIVGSYESSYEQERGKPMPSENHSYIQTEMSFQLKTNYGRQFDIFSELSLELTTGKAVPDICIYDKKPRDWKHDTIRRKDPPILAVEILSPKQNFNDITDKIFNIYFPAGVRAAWIVLPPAESIMLFTPSGVIKTFHKEMLTDTASGFDIDLNNVFV
jgi:Uma2 family endonuclease